jgi:hypothetical protein
VAASANANFEFFENPEIIRKGNYFMANLPGKTDGRGGARPGAGRKPVYVISEKEIKKLVRAARKKAEETGKTLADVLIDLAYQKDDKRTALGALRIYFDHTIVKNTERDINLNQHQHTGPNIYKINDRGEMVITKFGGTTIGLPEMLPDPALITVKGKSQHKDDPSQSD